MEKRLESEQIWRLLLALRHAIRVGSNDSHCYGLGLKGGQALILPADDPGTVIAVDRDGAWSARVPIAEAGTSLLDLYLPVALACRDRPLTMAHLGQSLDGRIATVHGLSHYINGPENLTHLHRMRALCDAVLVGASTVEADNPRLTTRRVHGPHPVRVVLDPHRRLPVSHTIFQDHVAPTLLVCDAALTAQPELGHAEVIGIPYDGHTLHLPEILRQLQQRGLFGIFIEGGGRTVSAFLQAGLLDRLQITIAPLIIGSGRPGISLPVIEDLSQGLRPRHRCYPMGEDILFDCQLPC